MLLHTSKKPARIWNPGTSVARLESCDRAGQRNRQSEQDHL